MAIFTKVEFFSVLTNSRSCLIRELVALNGRLRHAKENLEHSPPIRKVNPPNFTKVGFFRVLTNDRSCLYS